MSKAELKKILDETLNILPEDLEERVKKSIMVKLVRSESDPKFKEAVILLHSYLCTKSHNVNQTGRCDFYIDDQVGEESISFLDYSKMVTDLIINYNLNDAYELMQILKDCASMAGAIVNSKLHRKMTSMLVEAFKEKFEKEK